MDSQIRNVELNDINDLIRINELSIPAVNSITEAKFEWFYNSLDFFHFLPINDCFFTIKILHA